MDGTASAPAHEPTAKEGLARAELEPLLLRRNGPGLLRITRGPRTRCAIWRSCAACR
jgi:hypothetical protein